MEIKSNIPINKITHYVYLMLTIIVIVVFYAISLFLYRNFYLATTQSKVIVILKKDIATEVFDINKFNDIINKIENKTIKRRIDIINNPFK